MTNIKDITIKNVIEVLKLSNEINDEDKVTYIGEYGPEVLNWMHKKYKNIKCPVCNKTMDKFILELYRINYKNGKIKFNIVCHCDYCKRVFNNTVEANTVQQAVRSYFKSLK